MKKILLDVTALENKNQNAILGIKYFLSKNKQDSLTVIGDTNYTVTIHQNKRITIAQVDTDEFQIDNKYKDIKERNIAILFTLLNKENFDSFVTFDSINTLKPYIEKYLVKIHSPLLVSSFANYKTHKCTIIGDIAFNDNPTLNDYSTYVLKLKDYATNIYNFSNTRFKLMTSNNKQLEKLFKEDKDYQGILEPQDLYSADCDILITDPIIGQTAIKSIDGAITIYDSFIKASINKNIGYKLFSAMFKSMMSSFHLELDQKFTSGGITLLGFDKKAIFANKDTIAMGVKASIDNCSKF